jgi:predicted oxidoreductase
MGLFVWALALALTGCATREVVRTIEVKVPTPVPCVVDAGPARAFVDNHEALMTDKNIEARVNRVIAGRLQRDQRIRELEAANAGCQKP